jgi:hypothetical protein
MVVVFTFARLDILAMAATAATTTTARGALALALVRFFGSHFGRNGRLLGRCRIDHLWCCSGLGRLDGHSHPVRCGGFRCGGWLDLRSSFIYRRWR